MRLSRIAIVLIIFLSGITKIAAQDVAIKTNGLYWLAGGTVMVELKLRQVTA